MVNKYLFLFKIFDFMSKFFNFLGGWRKKANHFAEGGDFGNREQYINNLLRRMV